MSTEEAVAAAPDRGPAQQPAGSFAGSSAIDPPAGGVAPGEPASPTGARWPGSRRRRALQWAVPALVLALLDVGGLVWWHHRDATPAAAALAASTTRTLAVSPATLKENVTATGTLTPTVDDTFGFAVSGVVTHVYVSAGQTVKAGQVLATVGTAALAASLAQAKATVAADRATLAADTADSASSTQLAADSATITEAVAAVATAAANVAAATLRAPVAGEVTTFGLAVGDTVTGTAGGTGSGSTGSSGSTAAGAGSSSGTGSSSGAGSSGSTSSAGSAASSSSSEVEIVGTSSWEVATTVDDTNIGNLAVGDEATITLSLSSSSSSSSGTTTGGFGGFAGTGTGGFRYGGTGGGTTGTGTTGTGTTGSTGTAASTSTTTVYGTVTSIGLVPSTTTGVAAYPVVVTVTGTGPHLFSGMSATAAITYRQLTNVLAVPTTAITTSGSSHTVQVSANGRTTRTTVQTGAVVGAETQIVSGLTSGQEIVLPTVRGATGTTGTGRFGGTGAGGFGGTGGYGGRAAGAGNG